MEHKHRFEPWRGEGCMEPDCPNEPQPHRWPTMAEVPTEDPAKLLAEWLDWWAKDDDAPPKLPDALHVRTATFLVVRGYEQGIDYLPATIREGV